MNKKTQPITHFIAFYLVKEDEKIITKSKFISINFKEDFLKKFENQTIINEEDILQFLENK